MAQEPHKGELLASLTQSIEKRQERRESMIALVRRFEAMDRARAWFDVLAQLVPADADEQLREYYRFALLGVCFGFIERDLSPYIAEHLAIIPPLLDDIRSVYDQLNAKGTPYDPEEFRYRAYDYGLHKATYLDWRLYLSHEFY